jgi:hypothetical protein
MFGLFPSLTSIIQCYFPERKANCLSGDQLSPMWRMEDTNCMASIILLSTSALCEAADYVAFIVHIRAIFLYSNLWFHSVYHCVYIVVTPCAH